MRFARSAKESRGNCAMNANEQVRQWSAKHASQIIGTRESKKNRGENEYCHAGEKHVVKAWTAMANCACCHDPLPYGAEHFALGASEKDSIISRLRPLRTWLPKFLVPARRR